jgi:hypothetical protein
MSLHGANSSTERHALPHGKLNLLQKDARAFKEMKEKG